MTVSNSNRPAKPSAAARAEAAAWIARLHGPNRTPEVEAGWRRWMAEDPERRAAFELLTDTWEKSARLRRRPMEQVASWEMPGFRVPFSRAVFATVTVTALAVIGTVLFLRNGAVTTEIGEQRTLNLEDGTRLYLNTNSRAKVHYSEEARHVELEQGEALFEVARRPDWPFIVIAGDRQIRALGTAFVVRRDEEHLAVTLVEGKVTVSPLSDELLAESPLKVQSGAREEAPSSLRSDENLTREIPRSLSALQGEKQALIDVEDRALPTVADSGEAPSVFTLAPGQRLTFASNQPAKMDRPALERITAWQRGQVAFDHSSLADAVAEMNRYSSVRVVIEDPTTATINVSGIFRAGDAANFAQAVGRTYGLQVIEQRGQIVLAGKPTMAQHMPR